MRCQAQLELGGGQCRMAAADDGVYCRTHELLGSGRSLSSAPAAGLSLADEIVLAKLHVRQLEETGAPTTQVLNGLRTLVMLVRLEARLGIAVRGHRGRG
jgi:hypothetical protein